MKNRILIWIIALFPVAGILGQVPAGMNYQVLLYKPNGDLLQDQAVQLRISIVKDSAKGEPLMIELHQVKTNAYGLANLVVGTGKVVLGSLREIDWLDGPLFLQTEADLSGGNNFVLSAVAPLLGVPFALHSATTDSLYALNPIYRGGTYSGAFFFWDGSKWKELPKGAAGRQLAIDSSGLPAWQSHALPRLAAALVDSVRGTVAHLSSSVTDNGGYAVSSRGFVLGEHPGPLLEHALVVRQGQGTGAFRLSVPNLLPGRTYYVRSYATNLLGTAYGAESSFKVEGCKGNYPVALKLLVSDSLSDKDDPVFQLEPYDSMVTVEYILDGQVFTAERFTQILPNPGKDFKVFARGVDRLGCLYVSDTLEVQVYSTEYEAVCIPAFKHTPALSALNAFSFAADKYIGRAAPFRLAYDLSGGFDVMYLFEGDFLADGKLIGAVHLRSAVDTVYFTEEQTAIYLVFENPGIIPEAKSALNTLLSNLRQNADFIQLLALVEADMKTLGYVDEYSSDKQALLERIWTVLTPSSPQTVLLGEPAPLLTANGRQIKYDANGNTQFHRAVVMSHKGDPLSKDILFAGEGVPEFLAIINILASMLSEIEYLSMMRNLTFRSSGDSISYSDIAYIPETFKVVMDRGYPLNLTGKSGYEHSQIAATYNFILYIYRILNLFPKVYALETYLKSLNASKLSPDKCYGAVKKSLSQFSDLTMKVFISDLEGAPLTQEQVFEGFEGACIDLLNAATSPHCLRQLPVLSALLQTLKKLISLKHFYFSVIEPLRLVRKDFMKAPVYAEHLFMRSSKGFTGSQFYNSSELFFGKTLSGALGSNLIPEPKLEIKEYPYHIFQYESPNTDRGSIFEVELKGIPFTPDTLSDKLSILKVEFKPFIESVSIEKDTVKISPAEFKLSKADNIMSWKIRNSSGSITLDERISVGSIQFGNDTPAEIHGQISKLNLRRETAFCLEKDHICIAVEASNIITDNYPVRFKILSGGGYLVDISSSGLEPKQEVKVLAQQETLGSNLLASIARVIWKRGESGVQKLEVALVDEKGKLIDQITIIENADCGAYIAPNEWREFQCHNLGAANPKADPFTPSWEINGGYWQWGKKVMGAEGPTGPDLLSAKIGSVATWINSAAPKGSWRDTIKTEKDPCPEGYRIPTRAEWSGVAKHNEAKAVGESWLNSGINYASGRLYGDKLFLPAAGTRLASKGDLNNRGSRGGYWSSGEVPGTDNAYGHFFDNIGVSGSDIAIKASGQSVRCIKEVKECGAYIAPNVWKEFMCHNLGSANMDADPFTPSWEINGGYWQWGRKEMAAEGPFGPSLAEANAGEIAGWNRADAPNGSWSDTEKTANDPCPKGFRVPTIAQWEGVIANNKVTYVGSSWNDEYTNYTTGIKLGDKLFLPAAGYRYYYDGELDDRGEYGYYWSSSVYGSVSAWPLVFSRGGVGTSSRYRTSGHPVRCISE